MRSAWLALVIPLAAASAVAAPVPALPAKIPLRSAAERARQVAAFRARNHYKWQLVEADRHGFISHVITDDPAIVPASYAFTPAQAKRIYALLRANTDLFGIAPANIDEMERTHKYLYSRGDRFLTGELDVEYERPSDGTPPRLEIRAYFDVTAAPTIHEADVAARVVGARYHDEIGYSAPPQRDCGMTPAGPAGCITPIEHTRERDVTLARGDLGTEMWLYADGDTMRLVACVDASMLGGPPADRSWGNVGPSHHVLTPLGGAPALPLVVDLVTGQVVATHLPACVDPSLADQR